MRLATQPPNTPIKVWKKKITPNDVARSSGRVTLPCSITTSCSKRLPSISINRYEISFAFMARIVRPSANVADGSVMPGTIGPNPSLTLAAVADRVLCMLEGRIVLAGAREELTREQITEAYFGLRRREVSA